MPSYLDVVYDKDRTPTPTPDKAEYILLRTQQSRWEVLFKVLLLIGEGLIIYLLWQVLQKI